VAKAWRCAQALCVSQQVDRDHSRWGARWRDTRTANAYACLILAGAQRGVAAPASNRREMPLNRDMAEALMNWFDSRKPRTGSIPHVCNVCGWASPTPGQHERPPEDDLSTILDRFRCA